MLHSELMVRFEAPAEASLPLVSIEQIQPAEMVQPESGSLRCLAAVVGNVLAGGLFLGGLLWLPMGLQQLLDML